MDGLKIVTTREARKWLEYAWARKADQEIAQYNPLGGNGTQACANCLFFMSPNGCTVVESWPHAISPTGWSKYWTAVPDIKPAPLEVVIVNGDGDEDEGMRQLMAKAGKPKPETPKPGSTKDGGFNVMDWARKWLPLGTSNPVQGGFKCFKAADGAWWWFSYYSNNFRDRDTPPEIFSSKSHQEFVDWVDQGNDAPDLWYWHTPGTRFGKAVWVGFDEGLAWAAGTIDPGMEHVAEHLSTRKDLGVSHGYRDFTYSDPEHGIIGKHRTFEISPLPVSKAANLLTSFGVSEQEIEQMKITAEKRAELAKVFGEDAVTQFEQQGDDLLKQAARLGLESKDVTDETPAEGSGISADSRSDAAPPAHPTPDSDEVGKATAKALQESQGWKDMMGNIESIKANSDQVPGILTRLDALEADSSKSKEEMGDQLISSMMAEARKAGGYKASEAENNRLSEQEQAQHEGPKLPFDEGFLSSVGGPFGAQQ